MKKETITPNKTANTPEKKEENNQMDSDSFKTHQIPPTFQSEDYNKNKKKSIKASAKDIVTNAMNAGEDIEDISSSSNNKTQPSTNSTFNEKQDTFETRVISVGVMVREKRIQSKMTKEDLALVTEMRPICIELMEKGNYKGLSNITYFYGFLRRVCQALALPDEEIIDYLAQLDPVYQHIYACEAKPKGFTFQSNSQTNPQEQHTARQTATDGFLNKKNLIIIATVVFVILAISRFISRPNSTSIGDRFAAEHGYEAIPATPVNPGVNIPK